MQNLGASMRGFMNSDSGLDMAKFEGEYFQLLGSNFKSRSMEYSREFANSLLPEHENLQALHDSLESVAKETDQSQFSLIKIIKSE